MAYIMMVGRICGDSFDWDIAMPPLEEVEPVDGDSQRSIDEGEMTAELIDWMEDVEWMRTGCS
jgi:hypothetical protein